MDRRIQIKLLKQLLQPGCYQDDDKVYIIARNRRQIVKPGETPLLWQLWGSVYGVTTVHYYSERRDSLQRAKMLQSFPNPWFVSDEELHNRMRNRLYALLCQNDGQTGIDYSVPVIPNSSTQRSWCKEVKIAPYNLEEVE